MIAEAVFVQHGDGFLATDLALGPWYPGALHGGAPAALLVRAVMTHATGSNLTLARITYEFVRPVPRGPLHVDVSVVRPGRRVSLLDAVLTDDRAVEVVRARALLAVPSGLDAVTGVASTAHPFPGPDQGRPNDWAHAIGPGFVAGAMDIRFVEGRFRSPGPSVAWFRLRCPLVAGEETSPLQRLAAAGDFGNGIASELSWDDHVFINPDLTLYVERPPRGEWVALESHMRVIRGSVAMTESVLWDEHGRIGRAIQSLLVWTR